MDTREELLSIAFKHFLTQGYSNVSVNDIVQEIGLTKGGFYHHFKSKDELFQEVLEKFVFSAFENYMESPGLTKMSAKEVVRYIFVSMDDFYSQIIDEIGESEFSGFYILIFQGIKRFNFVQERMFQIYESMMKMMEQIFEVGIAQNEIRADLDVRATAFQIVSLLEGMFLMWVLNKKIDLKKESILAFENFWSILEKR